MIPEPADALMEVGAIYTTCIVVRPISAGNDNQHDETLLEAVSPEDPSSVVLWYKDPVQGVLSSPPNIPTINHVLYRVAFDGTVIVLSRLQGLPAVAKIQIEKAWILYPDVCWIKPAHYMHKHLLAKISMLQTAFLSSQ